MAAKHWVMGCGIGCGIILLLVIALFVAGGMWVKDMTEEFEGAVDLRAQLEERFGARGEFTPPADGAIPADRMQAFLAIREATAAPRTAMVDFFESLPDTQAEAEALEAQEGMQKAKSIFGIVGSALGFGKQIGVFFEVRNRALLASDMGMGEYTYLYVLVYRSWLGHDDTENVDEDKININGLDRGSDRELNRDLMRMLSNQLAALSEDADPEWRQTLIAELAAMEQDRDRLPWQDSVPAATAASLEPYRDLLESSYSPTANGFELLRNRKRGHMSFTTD